MRPSPGTTPLQKVESSLLHAFFTLSPSDSWARARPATSSAPTTIETAIILRTISLLPVVGPRPFESTLLPSEDLPRAERTPLRQEARCWGSGSATRPPRRPSPHLRLGPRSVGPVQPSAAETRPSSCTCHGVRVSPDPRVTHPSLRSPGCNQTTDRCHLAGAAKGL